MNEDFRSPEDVVRSVQSRWKLAFDLGDWPGVAQLYLPDAQLYGGKPELHAGPGRILQYFSALRAGTQVVFGFTEVCQPVSHVIVAAGLAVFRRDEQQRDHRLSWTLVFQGSEWCIASHHASPVPEIRP